MRIATDIIKKWDKEKILTEISKRTKETKQSSKRILVDLYKVLNLKN